MGCWRHATVADLFEIKDHERVPVNANERAKRRGSVPYYGATGQVGWIDEFLFDEELILLGEDAAPFLQSDKPKAYVIRGQTWVNNHAHVLRTLARTPSGFWKYQFDQTDFHGFVSGTTRLKLSQQPMRQIPLLVPPVQEQHRIVDAIESYFTRLDDAVASLERVQRNLKRYRASILKDAVEGRLVPTKAELTRAEGRDYESASVLLERVLAERRRRWEEVELVKMKAKSEMPNDDRWKAKYEEPVAPVTTDLPDLPEGWCWASIDQLTTDSLIGLVRNRGAQRLSGVGCMYVKMDQIDMDGNVSLEGSVRVDAEYDEIERYSLVDGDILFNTRNSVELVGKAGMVRHSKPQTLYNNNIMRIRTANSVSSPFIAYQMCSALFRYQIDKVKRATTSVAAIYGKDLFPCAIALPPREEQDRIVHALDAMFSSVIPMQRTIGNESVRVTRLRQSILKWAFEGRLVDQDPADEPVSKLLERIKSDRAAEPAGSPTRRQRRATSRRTSS
jgi:type I restriction enzyme, S subunit